MTNILIKNGLILTLNKSREIIQNGSIHIENDKIVEIGKNRELKKGKFDKIIDGNNKIIMPGLVNAHNHVNETIVRGLGADGLNQFRKNKTKYYWDINLWENFDKQICYDAAALSAVEMIKSGITTTQNSHYANFHKDSIDGIAESVLDSGMRIVLGRGCWDVPGLAPEQYLDDIKTAKREIERLIKTWNKKENDRIFIRAESSRFIQCSNEMILKTKEISQKHDIGWAIHLVSRLGEHPIDPRNKDPGIQRYNGRSVEYLSDLGVLGPESLLIHCGPQITNREIKILASKKTPIAHCPVMNAWAGRPHITPVPHMLEMGVTVGLGTDGASTNDSQDLFQAMKTCALLHKVNYGDSKAITAEKVIEISTIDSARALQLENYIGSIEVDKKADLIILDKYSPGLSPSLLPTKNLVYGAGCGNAVETVIIDGKIVMEDRKITTIDEETIFRKGEKAALRLLELSGEPEKYLKLMISEKWQVK